MRLGDVGQGQVNGGTDLQQQPASGILRCVDCPQGMSLLRKNQYFWHYPDAICSQIDQDHFVLGNVYSKVRQSLTQCEQSSESKNCESSGQVTRSEAHWFMSCGAICCCCSAPGTEQLPSSFRTTRPRWISSQSWS